MNYMIDPSAVKDPLNQCRIFSLFELREGTDGHSITLTPHIPI